MNTIAGRTMKSPPANLNASGDVERDASTCAGSVRVRSVRIVAANTSFHEITNVKIAAAARPGRARGNTMRRNAPQRLHPSVCAASSSSCETATNTPPVTRTMKGSAIAVCTRATEMRLS